MSSLIHLDTNNNLQNTIVKPGSNQSLVTEQLKQIYNQNTRDYAKGTSFRFLGEWETNKHYFNDEYYKDFVTFERALIACKKAHLSNSLNAPVIIRNSEGIAIGVEPSEYWEFVIASDRGPEGKQGPRGYKGDSATIQVGTVETIKPDQPAQIINSGTTSDAIFNFKIPKGETGDRGSVKNFIVLTAEQYEHLTYIEPNVFYYIYEEDEFFAYIEGEVFYVVGNLEDSTLRITKGEVENSVLKIQTAPAPQKDSYVEGESLFTFGDIENEILSLYKGVVIDSVLDINESGPIPPTPTKDSYVENNVLFTVGTYLNNILTSNGTITNTILNL